MNTAEKIKVMQAYLEGKTILRLSHFGWTVEFDNRDRPEHDPVWDWVNNNYEVKKDPVIWRACLWRRENGTHYVSAWTPDYGVPQEQWPKHQGFVRWLNETQTEEV